MISNLNAKFRILKQTYLGPTNINNTYGSITTEIVKADDERIKYNGITCNNIFRDYSEEVFKSEAEAQEAIEKSDGFSEYPTMNKSRTENHLYEAVMNSISSKTTNDEITVLVNGWATDQSDIEENDSMIDTDIATEMCKKARQELRIEEGFDDEEETML